MTAHRGAVDFVGDVLGRRAEAHRALPSAEAEALRQKIRARALDLLDTWEVLAHEQHKVGAGLQYAQEAGGAPPLLYQPTDPELLKKPPPVRKFKAARSLRDVEPSVNLWVENPDGAFLDPVGEAEGTT